MVGEVVDEGLDAVFEGVIGDGLAFGDEGGVGLEGGGELGADVLEVDEVVLGGEGEVLGGRDEAGVVGF